MEKSAEKFKFSAAIVLAVNKWLYVLGSFWHNAVKNLCSFFCEKWLNFYDLRTLLAKFCREKLSTFSADFSGLKN